MSGLDNAETSDLTANVSPESHITRLGMALAQHEEDDNKHRGKLFTFVLVTVGISLSLVVLVVILLGVGWLHLETPVAVAFISAVALQSFVLIGFLARGLFMTSKKDSKSSEAE